VCVNRSYHILGDSPRVDAGFERVLQLLVIKQSSDSICTIYIIENCIIKTICKDMMMVDDSCAIC
jgi:hypothetical protein